MSFYYLAVMLYLVKGPFGICEIFLFLKELNYSCQILGFHIAKTERRVVPFIKVDFALQPLHIPTQTTL